MSFYPNPEHLPRAQDDQVLFSFHRAKLYSWELLTLFVLLVAGVVFVNVKVANPEAVTPAWLRGLSLLPVLLFLEMVRRHYNEVTIIKANVIEHHEGKLAFAYSVPVVDYSDIREIRIDQTLMSRLLNFGDVSINTAGSDMSEMVLHGVPAPHEFKQMIERLRAQREESLVAEKRSQD